jgi:hypothetical protein
VCVLKHSDRETQECLERSEEGHDGKNDTKTKTLRFDHVLVETCSIMRD